MIRKFGGAAGIDNQPVGLLLGLGTGGNAGVGDVVSGKTFTNDAGQKTGTGAGAKRYAQGSFTYPSTLQTGAVTINGLDFTPSVVLFLLDCTSANMYSLSGVFKNSVKDFNIHTGIGTTTERFLITPISGGFTYELAAYSSSGYQILNNPITWTAFE